ncbi:MAG: geranylgeranyl diphosphate synthase, type [Mycobacterium sp.]|nr:geranylgeranyl diphosphate synthase, type [Mycobacterium sp.]
MRDARRTARQGDRKVRMPCPPSNLRCSPIVVNLLVGAEYFEQAFADARPGPDLDFLRSLVPYVWARWR